MTEEPEKFQKNHLQLLTPLKNRLIELIKAVDKGKNLNVNAITEKFFLNLSNLKDLLLKDARFIFEFDPAATSLEEVILAYPGFYAIMVYRLAHIILMQKVPLIARFMTEAAHNKTSIDIHPGAIIGSPFFIDHGTGMVIGETTIIGNYVRMYQNVTLGALSLKKAVHKEAAQSKRHPTIEDNVIIYANSTILGGDTIIGRDSIIGGNTWVTQSVPPFSVVYRQHQIVIKQQRDDPAE